MEICIPDNEKYAKALDILYQMGGLFRTRPTHVLVVGPAQFKALANAGLVVKNGNNHGAQKKKTAARS